MRSKPLLTFVDWHRRPAVLTPRNEAFAVLKPGGPWVSVDGSDVFHTGVVRSESHWRGFEAKFGPLDLSKLPLPKED
jgi:hypothetical protein